MWKAPPLLYIQMLALLAVLSLIIGYHYVTRGLSRYPKDTGWYVPAARAEFGPAKLRAHGCIACHTIPGVPGATGKVGPRLDRVGELVYIAGVLPMSPQNLVLWIQHPREVDPLTAMPDLGVGPEDARDMAAYLLSINEE